MQHAEQPCASSLQLIEHFLLVMHLLVIICVLPIRVCSKSLSCPEVLYLLGGAVS